MKSRFFSPTLRNKPLRSYAASSREIKIVWKVILGVGVPLSVAVEAGLRYGMNDFGLLASRWHWGADLLTLVTMSGFVVGLGLAMAATSRVMRHYLPR